MLHFNELRVTEDGKALIIDVEIDDIKTYKHCYIDSIKVDLGENCQKGGDSEHAITVFRGGTKAIGDSDNDGVITVKDVAVWKVLYALVGTKLLKDDYGYYYREQYVTDEGDNAYRSVYVKDIEEFDGDEYYADIVAWLYEYIRGSYDNGLEGNAHSGIGAGQLLNYVYDVLGDKISYFKSAIHGDLNNDGEISIRGVDYFIAYLNDVSNATETTLYDTRDDRHVRLCLKWSGDEGLSALVKGKDLSENLFIVKVEANPGEDAEELAMTKCGCDPSIIVGLAFNGKKLYNAAVGFASSYGDVCDTTSASALQDFLFRYYGFMFSLKNGDLCSAWHYWSTFFQNNVITGTSPKGCGCHGTR